MTVVASIALDEDAFVLGQILAGTTARIELAELVPIGNGLVPYFWVTDGHDPATFEAHAREESPAAGITRLDENDERTLYRIDWVEGSDDFFAALADNDVMVDEGARTADEWLFRLCAPDRDALSAFRDDCEAGGVEFTLRHLLSNPTSEDSLADLSEKQREALELAFEHGYFEVPHRTSMTDLAEIVGVSQQAFSGRLQRAQQAVFARLLPLNE